MRSGVPPAPIAAQRIHLNIESVKVSSWLQVLTGHDQLGGRALGKRLRRDLVCMPARVTGDGGLTEIHFAPEDDAGPFADAWCVLDELVAAIP